jgi:hypothetical protein
MALLASAIGLDKPAMIELVGSASVVNQYAQNDDDNITRALDAATDAFRSAAIKGSYSSTSVDALTSSTCPVSVKRWILHLALDELTSGGGMRPDTITKYGDEARKWLSRVAGGAETIDGLTKSGSVVDGASGTGHVRSKPRPRSFDRDDEELGYDARNPKI